MGRPSSWPALRADLGRYVKPAWTLRKKLRALLTSEGAWLCLLYRSGTWIYFESPRALTPLLKLLWKPADLVLSTVLDVHISPKCNIGPGLYIGHHGGVWINPYVKMGASCNIAQGVVIGVAGPRPHKAPVIGDRVWIGPHAVISGRVKVGNDAAIGANSLVVRDVPPRALVVGVPAELVSYSGSFQLIREPSVPPPAVDGELEGQQRD